MTWNQRAADMQVKGPEMDGAAKSYQGGRGFGGGGNMGGNRSYGGSGNNNVSQGFSRNSGRGGGRSNNATAKAEHLASAKEAAMSRLLTAHEGRMKALMAPMCSSTSQYSVPAAPAYAALQSAPQSVAGSSSQQSEMHRMEDSFNSRFEELYSMVRGQPGRYQGSSGYNPRQY